MDLVKKIIELLFYFEQDKSHGKPYWRDPTVIGLAVSLAGTGLLKYAGVNIDSDLQLKIVGTVTGIGALFSPHTGIVAKKAAAPKKEEEHNLTGLY